MPAYRPIKFMNFDYYKQLSLNVSYCLHMKNRVKLLFRMIENTFELLNDLVNYLSKILKLEVRHPNLLTLILRAIKSYLVSGQSMFDTSNFDTE